MRLELTIVVLVLAAVVLTGMGDLGGVPEGTVPKTEENIKSHLVDRSGTATQLSRFSAGGKLFMDGRRGQGDLSVPLRDLKQVTFGQASGGTVPAELLLKSGRKIELKVPRTLQFHGDTGYGAFRIMAGEVSRIEFN